MTPASARPNQTTRTHQRPGAGSSGYNTHTSLAPTPGMASRPVSASTPTIVVQAPAIATEDDHVPHDGQRGERAQHADEHQHERRRIAAADDPPQRVQGKRREPRADEPDADEIRRDHEKGADEAADDGGQHEIAHVRRPHRGRREHGAEKESVEAENDAEEPVASETGDQAAHGEHQRCWRGVAGGQASKKSYLKSACRFNGEKNAGRYDGYGRSMERD